MEIPRGYGGGVEAGLGRGGGGYARAGEVGGTGGEGVGCHDVER